MTFLENRDFEKVPSIPEYFKGKSILITGGSGFIGKLTIEKLLYSCPELEKIYLIIRDKKGVKAEDRLATLYDCVCFDRLRNERPGLFESKVQIIAGDMRETQLGISNENRAKLIKTVNVIFHIAANVRFNDFLVDAVKSNLISTKNMLSLAKEMLYLESFIHMSTAFSNTWKECIEEVIYTPFADWRETIDVCENLDDRTLQVLTQKYIGGAANTYVFTKHLAERMVYEENGKLPVVIYRPSVVMSTLKEPLGGWTENFNGPMGINIATAKGILHSIYSDFDVALDMIPACSVVRGAIVAAWSRGTKKLEVSDECPIYNACDAGRNQLTGRRTKELGHKLLDVHPFDTTWMYASGNCYKTFIMFYIWFMLLQTLPAIFIDGILLALGKKPILLKIQRRIYVACIILYPFGITQWRFSARNFTDLCIKIKDQDRQEFDFIYENINFEEYILDSLKCARKYLLKERDEDLPKAKVHRKRVKLAYYIAKYLFYGYVLWWVCGLVIKQLVTMDDIYI